MSQFMLTGEDDLTEIISRHQNEYFRTLRSQMALYPTIPFDDYPDLYLGHRQLRCHVGSDGVVIAQYKADNDSFEVIRTDESIDQIVARISGGPIPFPVEVGDLKNSIIQIRDAQIVHPSGAASTGAAHIVVRPPWELLTVTRSLDARRWRPEIARADALGDIHAVVAAHLLKVPQAGRRTTKGLNDQTLQSWGETIHKFQDLLEGAKNEMEIQRFLEQNTILLASDSVQVWPQFRLGGEYIVDFVITASEERYILVEIEAANHNLLNRNGDFSAIVGHAQKQVEDWMNWIEEAPDYARKLLPGINEPEGWVIIGRRPRTRSDRRSLERKNKRLHRIVILTYDDLIERSSQQLVNLQNHIQSRQ